MCYTENTLETPKIYHIFGSTLRGMESPTERDHRETQYTSPKQWKRTRSGCLNCRRKRRKCDEKKPTCSHCQKTRDICRWGMRITFRAENTQTVQMPVKATRIPKHFEILDITSEVIRDYHQLVPDEDSPEYSHILSSPDKGRLEYDLEGRRKSDSGWKRQKDTSISRPKPRGQLRSLVATEDLERQDELNLEVNRTHTSHNYPDDLTRSATSYYQEQLPCSPDGEGDIVESFSTNNLWLRQVLQRDKLSGRSNDTDYSTAYSPLSQSVQSGYCEQPIAFPDFHLEDGIFVPGSGYLELHSTLRNHLILEARSGAPTRHGTPDHLGQDPGNPIDQNSPRVNLPKEEEYTLWKNWLEEIAPWLDKFDNQCHFQNTLLAMARSHNHLRYSMLALSARQLERKGATAHKERSLEFYHHAIHLLLPLLPTRSTAVIASCVVLCVLEMLSCAPQAWRRHLDGCAGLMEAVGINGFSGGPEQALFWCFARMDICGGLISSTKTLIPVNHWATGINIDADVRLFRLTTTIDSFANCMVYLCAQVLDILAPCYHSFDRTSGTRNNSLTEQAFCERWSKVWFYVQDWYSKRPEEMKPVMDCSSPDSSFPTILFANPAAISGNQLYHTAALLMLQARPPGLRLDPKPRSALWHARQVCGISINNHHHGAWTNAIQPLWIAGQWMSHPSEHREILDLLERIEKESGWPTQWRADDLKEFWG